MVLIHPTLPAKAVQTTAFFVILQVVLSVSHLYILSTAHVDPHAQQVTILTHHLQDAFNVFHLAHNAVVEITALPVLHPTPLAEARV